jgi:hypothetical protein
LSNVVLNREAQYFKVEVMNAGTRYIVHEFIIDEGATHFALETGWGSYYGQWIQTGSDSIHWSYLTEKMPGLREGDKEGWKLAFAAMGVEVFG